MSESKPLEESTAQQLSALMDGEIDADAAAQTCRAWRTDPGLRADWHAYSLIGDVLRSADLAKPSASDQAFLAAVHERLAREPVPLAPSPSPAILRARRHRWMRPLGIAAGVAMVTSLAWTIRPSQPDTAPIGVISLVPEAAPQQGIGAMVVSAPPQGTSEPLEPYLNAHRMVPAKAAFGPAPGFMRSVAHEPQTAR
jgi:sigma-E factor negative regulatory protein RseA